MFRELQGLPEDSAKFSRQRDRIGLGVQAVAIHDHADVVILEFDVRSHPHTPIIHRACTTGVSTGRGGR